MASRCGRQKRAETHHAAGQPSRTIHYIPGTVKGELRYRNWTYRHAELYGILQLYSYSDILIFCRDITRRTFGSNWQKKDVRAQNV